jgi:hypothetical protein
VVFALAVAAVGLAGGRWLGDLPARAAEAKSQQPDEARTALDAGKPEEIEKQWGVQLQGMHVSAAGYMLDFRFKVLDPGKAAPLLDRKNKAFLIAEKNNARLDVPKIPRIGALRQTTTQVMKDKIYYLLFGNPGKTVQADDKVTVNIGDFKVAHITVDDLMSQASTRPVAKSGDRH